MSSSFSDISDEDVSEGTVVNPVHQSQVETFSLNPSACSAQVDPRIPRKKRVPCDYKNLPNSSVTLFKSSEFKRRKVKNIERFEQFQRSVQEKISLQRLQREEEEAKDCTFTPSINRSNEVGRSFDEQYESLMKYQKQRDDKVNRLREETPVEVFEFKPRICKNSIKLIQTKPYFTGQCHERLYKSHKENYKFAEDPPFVPQVNKKSKKSVRTRPIDEVLYEDAKRRQMVRTSSDSSFNTVVSANSLAILVKKFTKEFEEKAKKLDPDLKGSLNYSLFVHLLQSMNFVSTFSMEESKLLMDLWKMTASEAVRISDLKAALMGIMGYYQPWMKHNPGLPLNSTEVQRMHDKFMVMYQNRMIRRPNVQTQNSRAKPLRKEEEATQIVMNTINRVREAKTRSAHTDICVDVNFEDGFAELHIGASDDPMEVVNSFARDHNLSQIEHLELKERVDSK